MFVRWRPQWDIRKFDGINFRARLHATHNTDLCHVLHWILWKWPIKISHEDNSVDGLVIAEHYKNELHLLYLPYDEKWGKMKIYLLLVLFQFKLIGLKCRRGWVGKNLWLITESWFQGEVSRDDFFRHFFHIVWTSYENRFHPQPFYSRDNHCPTCLAGEEVGM